MNGSKGEDIPIADEEIVIGKLKRGDREAAAQLYQWFGDRLFRCVILPRLPVREAAEDVLKIAFQKAFSKIEQFEPKGNSIYYWLRRIAINLVMDHYRSNKRERKMKSELLERGGLERTVGQPPPRPDRKSELDETRSLVLRSLSTMNERYAKVLRLRLLEDRDREECAAAMGITVNNFDVLLHRACKAFRKGYPP